MLLLTNYFNTNKINAMKTSAFLHVFTCFFEQIKLKTYSFIVVLGLMSVSVFANPPMASKQQVGMFINSKTCVVLESGSISYNVYIKNAVQKYLDKRDDMDDALFVNILNNGNEKMAQKKDSLRLTPRSVERIIKYYTTLRTDGQP